MERAGDVFDLRFEARERRGLRLFAATLWQAVTLADTVPGNDAGGAGGTYVVTRRADGVEVVRVEVAHEELGATRAHLERQLADLSASEFRTTWGGDDGGATSH